MPVQPRPVAERFWAKVVRSPACWEWIGAKDGRGYGRVHDRGRPRAAHRVAWEITVGPIPEGLCVLHHCDNPPCVRPDHLFLGTLTDNQADAVAKGRQQPWSVKGWQAQRALSGGRQ